MKSAIRSKSRNSRNSNISQANENKNEIKLPKIDNLPAAYEILSNPLFNLPKEQKRIPISKYSIKKLPPQSRKLKSKSQTKDEKRSVSYTVLRKRREEFRKRIVALIVKSDDEDDEGILRNEDKEFLRYYYFIHHGIDTVHVAPLDKKTLKRVYNLIPPKLYKWRATLRELIAEMKDDYVVAVKKAVVDFVLQDTRSKEKMKQYTSADRTELKEMSKDWRPSFEANRAKIKHNLHAINPCLAQTLDIWHKNFSTLRLINLPLLISEHRAFDLNEFQILVIKSIEDTKHILSNLWYPKLKDVFLFGHRKKHIPERHRTRRLKRIYDCAAVIMTYQLQTLCIQSILDFTNYIQDIGNTNRGLKIHLTLSSDALLFEPPFKNIKITILEMYDFMIKAISDLPRLETQVYSDYVGDISYLKPIIPEDIVTNCKRQIYILLQDHRIGPELRVQDFDDYIDLINGNVQIKIEEFIATPHTFEQTCILIENLKSTSNEIPITMEHVVTIGLYDMHREDLIKSLVQAAIGFKNQLIAGMVVEYQEMMRVLGDDYEEISKKALTIPSNTAELMAVIAFVNETERKTVYIMEDRLRDVLRYMLFLTDHSPFNLLEIKQNNLTFQWYLKLPSIFEEHRQIVDVKTVEYQQALKTRIEKFLVDLQKFSVQVDECQKWGDPELLVKYRKKTTSLDNRLNNALEKIILFNAEERSFGYELSEYPLRQQIHDKLKPYKDLYDNCVEFLNKHALWMNARVGSFDPDEIDSQLEDYLTTVSYLENIFGDAQPKSKDLAADIRERMESFKHHMPIIHTLGNPGMKNRHWERVSDCVGFPIKVDEELTLAKVIDYGFDDFVDKFEIISNSATKENELEEVLNKMMGEWADMKFNVFTYRDTGTYILSSFDDIQLLLDDHIVKTQTMKSSPYIQPFEKVIAQWEGKLMLLQDILDEWLKVQGTWTYLEPIFSSPDIQQQMPEEGRRFSAVDKMWRDIMRTVYEDTKVLSVIEIDKMSEKLKKSSSLLDIIQKGLNDYLEKKRLYFPRFFFLSNDELLEILSETKDPTMVQPHLRKCFEGIAKLHFTGELEVTQIISFEDEVVPLTGVISTAKARGQVEKWLLELENFMKKSMHEMTRGAFNNFKELDLEKWVFEWPGQSVQCISMTYWTTEVHFALSKGKNQLSELLKQCNAQISKLISLIRGKLSTQNRITLAGLVILDVHAKDVVSEFIENNVNSEKDFQWLGQLRYYFEQNQLFTRMVNSKLKYGNEYLGNTERLVVTPLTVRCFRTLFGALQFHLGGAPEGPAGSGKTETVKDLAKGVGKQCVVFNCSDSIDYIVLGKFFKGISACGAWCCFDDFNRIKAEVLSVVAQQILNIQRGISTKKNNVVFDGTELKLDSTCAVFITMNPGYTGRNVLPDNLKVLFRPVAMMIPDFEIITEVELLAIGFSNAKALAVKVITAYRLCYELLSLNSHYDFGMRTVKSVLTAAAALKLHQPNENEDYIILRSIQDVNFSKIIYEDLPLFDGILSDLFPGISLRKRTYEALDKAISEVCEAANIQCIEYFIGNVHQLYEMLSVKLGVMTIGLPFAGKTSTYKMLAKALALLEERKEMNEHRVTCTIINPKSITMGQLLGEFDAVTHEWTDGIVAITCRSFATSITSDRKWLVFDGPVDTIWIENINTMLDDNRKLCLMSSAIIHLPSTTNAIFETMDLDVASPATISRCGMIHMEASSVGWGPLLKSWINTLPPVFLDINKTLIMDMFFRFCKPLLWLIRNGGLHQTSNNLDSSLVKSIMNIFDCFMDDFYDEKYMETCAELDMRAQQEGVFFFSCIWALGGPLDAPSRDKFNILFRALLEKEFPNDTKEMLNLPFDIDPPIKAYIFIIPKDGSVFDYRYIKDGKGKWKPWTDELLVATPIPREIPVNQIIVQTIETVRTTALLTLLVQHQKPMMLVGPTGTGKSIYSIDFLLKRNDIGTYKPLFMNFSPKTTANQSQETIMSKLDKRRKGIFGPPLGKKCVVFVDDVEMPQKEIYGAQPPVELLRQWFDHKQWYDVKDMVAMKIVDVQLICAMGLTDDQVTPRFARHFNTLAINEFSSATMVTIFSRIMLWHLDTRGFSKEFDPCISEIVNATLSIYKKVKTCLLPTPNKSHYMFNLRDFSRVIQGVLLSVPESTEGLVAMKRLWVHEVLRVYCDRLDDKQDKAWFYEELYKVVKEYLGEDMNEMFPRLMENGSTTLGEEEFRKLLYCDFTNPLADPRLYLGVLDLEGLCRVVEGYLIEFNNMTKKPMNLVLFTDSTLYNILNACDITTASCYLFYTTERKRDIFLTELWQVYRFAIEHLSRICRILKQPRSHALLIGVGGSGRQSLARLAAHVSDDELFQIELNKNFGVNEWKEFMKNMFRAVSATERHGVFLFADTQIKEDIFLEDTVNLLNYGEIANLFSVDERVDIIDKMRQLDAQREKMVQTDGSVISLNNLFVTIIREQLHVILVMSPIGNNFRKRIRQFPCITNCCSIDWFQDWPPDALSSVTNRFLSTVNLSEDELHSICEISKVFHKTTQVLSNEFLKRLNRHIYVTPASYFEMIGTFKILLEKKREELTKAKDRYENGIKQLEFAASQMIVLQKHLDELQPQLAAAAAQVHDITNKVENEIMEAADAERVVLKDEEAVNAQADAAQSIKADIATDLLEVAPMYEEAVNVVTALTPADTNSIKAMKNPPRAVKILLEAICIIKDVKPDKMLNPSGPGTIDDYWGPSRKLISDAKFIENLCILDKDNIPPPVMKKLADRVLENEDFDEEKIKAGSPPAEFLYKWVIAVVNYDKVAKIVAPKRISFAEAENDYKVALAALEAKRATLREVQANLIKLQKESEQNKQHQTVLIEEQEFCTKKLQRAEILIEGLGGEKSTWEEKSVALGEEFKTLEGDVLMGAGIIAYLGPFSSEYRERQIIIWKETCSKFNMPCLSDYNMSSVLSDAVTVRQWKINGISSDAYSIENGIIAKNSRRFPIMIDPQLQANKWIRDLEKPNHLSIIRLTQGDYPRILENAIQFGQPILLENIGEDIDPTFDALLQQQKFKHGGSFSIKVGETIVEYNNNFRLYMTTKLSNPHYRPETSGKITLINFVITVEGLENKMLGITIGEEKPDQETDKVQLTIQGADNKRQLQEIEDKILRILTSDGNILENETAVNNLSAAKVTSTEISLKQATVETMEKPIDDTRLEYTSIAQHISVLYYTVADLAHINHMYQFSLSWFVKQYTSVFVNVEKVDDIPTRLKAITKYFTFSLYCNVCRGLYEKDKLLFALLLTINIMKSNEELNLAEWMFFLNGSSVNSSEASSINCLSNKSWNEICSLSAIDNFQNLSNHLTDNLDQWEKYFNSSKPDELQLPEPWKEKLNTFQKLLILRCLRPDKLVPGIESFVADNLGKEFVESHPSDLLTAYTQSDFLTPIVLIITPGCDPTSEVYKFADNQGCTSKFFSISLGENQGPIAAKILDDGIKTGQWILIQNCHFAGTWLKSLGIIVDSLTADTTHPDFRLWLTTHPTEEFPPAILDNGINVMYEPVTGLKGNMLETYLCDPILNLGWFGSCQKSDVFKKLLFSLCFFHATLLERKKYGSVGWNNPYEFNETDLLISMQELKLILNEYEDIKFDALRYLVGECNYGGKVTDFWDTRSLKVILKKFYCTEVVENEEYTFDEAGVYYAPKETDHESHLKYIRQLPLWTKPSLFGLNDNIDVVNDNEATRQLLSNLLLTQDRTDLVTNLSKDGSIQEHESPEAIAYDFVQNILSKLPPNFDVIDIAKKYPPSYDQSQHVFLVQELDRFNIVLSCIRGSLISVQKAIKGIAVSSPQTEEVINSILAGQSPKLWMKLSYPSLKPLGSYIDDFLERLLYFQRWCDNGPPNIFSISKFFFTQAFITGIKQNHARKNSAPINLLDLDFEVFIINCYNVPAVRIQTQTDFDSSPAEGVLINGMFLEGARWDSKAKILEESLIGVLYEEAPVIKIIPLKCCEVTSRSDYLCPLYKTSERRGTINTIGHSSNFVIAINLPTQREVEHWVLRGVAMLCQLSQ